MFWSVGFFIDIKICALAGRENRKSMFQFIFSSQVPRDS